MKIKKSNIAPILATILLLDDDGKNEVSGLLMEKIPMSLRRRLQRFRSDLLIEFKRTLSESNELKQKFTGDELKKEVDTLLSEEVTVNHDYLSLEMIEAIETSVNYDFKIIELFAK